MSDQIKEMPNKTSDNSVTLELGDIIQINAQKNDLLHENTFFISYIDDQVIELHNITTFEPVALQLDDNGILTDESIQEILLLSRSNETGYARQHLLLPKTWIDLHFNGDPYTSITGEITNLEEDMIEITTYPDMKVIYIDFAYQGIPKYLPLENITIRLKPKSLEKIASLVDIRDQNQDDIADLIEDQAESTSSMQYSDSGEMIIRLPEGARPDRSVRDELHEMYSVANEIIYGEELGEYVQRKEIPPHMQRFSIETQVNDMLDELLMDVPVEKRTYQVMDNIHSLIERFRELREEFSHFDANGNVTRNRFLGNDYKPLVERLQKLDQKLKWIVPVVALRKKIYSSEPNDTYQDVERLSMGDVLLEDQTKQNEYLQNQMRIGEITPYVHYNQSINPSFTPMEPPTDANYFIAANRGIGTSLEGIVNNLENFYSTVSFATREGDGYARKQYVIQKYNMGSHHLGPAMSKGGKRVFVREPMTPNDEMTIRSFITLPLPALHFSKVNLPMSSILTKTQYSQHFLQMNRLFHKKLDITTQNISLRENKSDEMWKMWSESGTMKQTVQDFVVDEHEEYSEDRFDKYLRSVFPGGETVVRMLDKLYPASRLSSMLSIHRATTALEPFMIYHNTLNYTQYNSIRFFIKEQLKKYRIDKEERNKQLNEYRMHRYEYSTPKEASIPHLFFEKQDLLKVFLESYQLNRPKQSDSYESLSSPEIYSKILADDFGTLFYDLLQFMMASLVVPENLMRALDASSKADDMDRFDKIKADDCVRRNLTKKYTSLDGLHKDNGNMELFYDREYDFTPYKLLDKYKSERKKMGDKDFMEFLTEVLIHKHDVPTKVSMEMAKDMMLGNKLVREGEYALVEIKPEPKMGLDEDSMTPNEKRAMTSEADLRKKVAYYRRRGNQWVVDQDVDENAFIDSADLFCNLSKFCFTDQKTKRCESMDDASRRLHSNERKKITTEFDERFAKSSRDMQEEMKYKVEISMSKLKSLLRYHYIKTHKANHMAFELGRFAKKTDSIRSPAIEARDKILAQGDFVKIQSDVLLFVERCCRDPMVDQLGENPYMLYCKKTNTPLLPTFYRELAQAFVSTGNYLEKLGEIVRKQGVEDGDLIFDKFTGFVLRKIDMVAEDMYTEDGFKIVTNDVLEEDIGRQFIEMMSGKTTVKEAVFEDEETQMIFNLYRGISRNLGIPVDSIQEKVMRMTQEIIAKTVSSKEIYIADAKAKEDATKRRAPPYEIYRNKSIILTVASVILYSIQTAIPSFRIHKTFPGCVQSFDGFPDKQGSIENTLGVEYIACILNKMKTKTTVPWNAIKPLPVEIIKSQMMQIIREAILPDSSYMEEYAKKTEYLLYHPDQDIPKVHSIQRWVQFLPPVVKFSVKKELRGLSNEYKDELIEMQRKGSKTQRDQLAVFMTKCHTFGFGIIEAINEIVKSKGLLLKTASQVYYTDNACCNDRLSKSTLQYFEEENVEITAYTKMITIWQKVIYETTRRARASFLYDPRRTGLTFGSELPSSHFETNIYLAFIEYCQLDNLHPIPTDLQPLFPAKIPDYPKTAPLMEKIAFLKNHGKRFTAANLKQLMAIIHRRNLVETYITNEKGSRIQGLMDFLSYADERYGADDDNVLSYSLREKMRDVLNKYNPKIMVIEDNEETYKLNNWLSRANEDLLLRITTYLEKHARLTRPKLVKLQEFLANIHMWNSDQGGVSKKDESSMYVVAQFLRNAVTANSNVFPEMIMNNHIVNSKSHKYWNFSDEHDLDISHFIRDYYKSLDKFKKDPTLRRLVGDVKEQLVDVNLFLSMIPLHSPYHKTQGGETQSFYSLFDKRTVYMIYCYVYYSVLYEYIRATENEDLLRMDVLEKKNLRRDAIRENTDEFMLGVSQEDSQTREEAEYGNDRIEVEIIAGNEEEIKHRIAELLLSFLEIDILNKKTIDVTYEENDRKVIRTRLKEKKLITDFLRDLDPEQRRVEDMNKAMKIGRWNVGLRAGLVKYDAERYEEERKQLFEQLNGRLDLEEISDVPVRKNAEQLEQELAEAADEFYDREANDISEFRGDDADGGYYDEDFEGDMEE